MPPKRRKPIGQVQPKAKRMKVLRRGESVEERERRLAGQRERVRAVRASETAAKREARLQDMRETVKTYRRCKRETGHPAERNRCALTPEPREFIHSLLSEIPADV
ncbi:uncharacterized protein Hap1MRO34_006976 isoform 1-T3 [Clarias gariepinus]